MHKVVPEQSLRLTIVGFFPAAQRGANWLNDLAECIDALVFAEAIDTRIDAWVNLVEWARKDKGDLRLRLLLDLLAGESQVRQRCQDAVATLLIEARATNLLSDSGIPTERGFLGEFSDRLIRHVLPSPRDDHDLSRLLHRQYRTESDIDSLRRIRPEVFCNIVALLFPEKENPIWHSVHVAFHDSFLLLASYVQAQGLTEKLRARSHSTRVANSPFYCLISHSRTLIDTWATDQSIQAAAIAWRECCANCRNEAHEIFRRLETDGVNVDIVYGLEVIDRCLERMEWMIQIMESPNDESRCLAVHVLVTQLAVASRQGHSLRYLVNWNLQLLQRRIFDRAGEGGEHYIANDKKEYFHIWAAAAGGGLLTCLTAVIKMAIVGAGLALFVEGLASGINFALSFLLLQLFGFMLATKQPAMTAAKLAAILRDHSQEKRDAEIVEFVTRICSSQIAAAAANIIFVSIGAIVFDLTWRQLTGHHYLDAKEAAHVFATLSPVDSGTIFYAALTGVILFIASLVGGWFDNWAVYHRLPQAIAEHRWGNQLGRARMLRLAGIVSRNISGWGTNISLGLMLGMTPALGYFLGLPIDVRHVTLSSGLLSLSITALDSHWYSLSWLLWAMVGIVVMFVLNLGVSFLLSLYSAARAYNIPRSELVRIGKQLLKRMFTKPSAFLFPPFLVKKYKG